MPAEDDLDSKSKRDFWRSLRDPLYVEQHEIYNKNKRLFTEEDKRIKHDMAKLLSSLNKKLSEIDK